MGYEPFDFPLSPVIKISVFTCIYFLSFCERSKKSVPFLSSMPTPTWFGGIKRVLNKPDVDAPDVDPSSVN